MVVIFLIVILISMISLVVYFSRWKDDRPDLGGFGGRK